MYADDWTTIHHGDCLDVMRGMDADSIDAIVTDPPYGLEFMGKDWDAPWKSDPHIGKTWGTGMGKVEMRDGARRLDRPSFEQKANVKCRKCGHWRVSSNPCKCDKPDFPNMKHANMVAFQLWATEWAVAMLRVAKPGAYLVAFGGTRTYHRLACAIEDAGWEVRDCLGYLYGSGFPKSLNLDKSDVFCSCESNGCTPPYDHERNSEQTPEHDLRLVRDADVPSALDACGQRGQVLLEGVSEHGSPAQGRQQLPAADVWCGQSSLEGRRDVPEAAWQLRDGEVRPCARVGEADVEAGRLRDGASPGDGADARTTTGADGVRASSRPRSVEQHANEPRAVADESGSQARGVWPICGGCGKPQIPRGLGTSLKPAWEPIILARKPLTGTVAGNVQRWGTGALNIDGCRVGTDGGTRGSNYAKTGLFGIGGRADIESIAAGRWPANIVLSWPEDEYELRSDVSAEDYAELRRWLDANT